MDRELPRQDEIWRHFNQYDPLNWRVVQLNNNLRAVLNSENGPLVLGKRKALQMQGAAITLSIIFYLS